eukprot:474404_1
MAEAANYPFCTIDPNIAKVSVPDKRLDELARVTGSAKTIYSQIEFVDIAGLIRGSHKGAGLGNKFLSHVREVDVLVQVVRCFESESIGHVDNSVDPVRDIETIGLELALADLEVVERRKLSKKKLIPGISQSVLDVVLDRCGEALNDGNPVNSVDWDESEQVVLESLQLLTSKPMVYVCNVDEATATTGNEHTRAVEAALKEGRVASAESVIVPVEVEHDASTFDTEDSQLEYLSDAGMTETCLQKIVTSCRSLLREHNYYTLGPKQAVSWTIPLEATALMAAAKIHTDFADGFVKAEIMTPEDYLEHGSEEAVKTAGKTRVEGRDYIVNDGDIMLFRFQKR